MRGWQDLSGETLQRAPDYSGTVYLEYTHEVGGGWDMDAYTGYTFRDESTTVISNEFGADSLELLDARLSFSNADNGWMVALKGNNLTDERKLILRRTTTCCRAASSGDQHAAPTRCRCARTSIRAGARRARPRREPRLAQPGVVPMMAPIEVGRCWHGQGRRNRASRNSSSLTPARTSPKRRGQALRREEARWQAETRGPVVGACGERKESFRTQTMDWEIKPLTRRSISRTAVSITAMDAGFPGEYPFTRGVDANGNRSRLWTMAQVTGFGKGMARAKRARTCSTVACRG
ncbi:MAG: TonB-dependent receptor [Gammaproteobacteria bacterium]|nr:TonB-dependent receptor [Gammaproteobacteria bacterium]